MRTTPAATRLASSKISSTVLVRKLRAAADVEQIGVRGKEVVHADAGMMMLNVKPFMGVDRIHDARRRDAEPNHRPTLPQSTNANPRAGKT